LGTGAERGKKWKNGAQMNILKVPRYYEEL
jgi:hypothetical protein